MSYSLQRLEVLVKAMHKAQVKQDKAQASLHAENVRLRKDRDRLAAKRAELREALVKAEVHLKHLVDLLMTEGLSGPMTLSAIADLKTARDILSRTGGKEGE